MCVSPALLPDLHCPDRWQHTCAVYSLRTKTPHSSTVIIGTLLDHSGSTGLNISLRFEAFIVG